MASSLPLFVEMVLQWIEGCPLGIALPAGYCTITVCSANNGSFCQMLNNYGNKLCSNKFCELLLHGLFHGCHTSTLKICSLRLINKINKISVEDYFLRIIFVGNCMTAVNNSKPCKSAEKLLLQHIYCIFI